jgi:hypothetical protein
VAIQEPSDWTVRFSSAFAALLPGPLLGTGRRCLQSTDADQLSTGTVLSGPGGVEFRPAHSLPSFLFALLFGTILLLNSLDFLYCFLVQNKDEIAFLPLDR